MKKNLLTGAFLVLGTCYMVSQTTIQDNMLKEQKQFSDRTLFQQFEQDMTLSGKEREIKKKENRAKRELLLTIIDTTALKADFKQKLRYDVIHNPFSKRLGKFVKKYNVKDKMRSLD